MSLAIPCELQLPLQLLGQEGQHRDLHICRPRFLTQTSGIESHEGHHVTIPTLAQAMRRIEKPHSAWTSYPKHEFCLDCKRFPMHSLQLYAAGVWMLNHMCLILSTFVQCFRDPGCSWNQLMWNEGVLQRNARCELPCNQATVLVLQELCHFLTQGLWYFILLQIASQQAKFRVPRVERVAPWPVHDQP